MSRNIRENLSNKKGMNVKTFVHSSDELVETINLKPTGNGLETRNGARTVLDGSYLTALHGEQSDVMSDDNSDGIITLDNNILSLIPSSTITLNQNPRDTDFKNILLNNKPYYNYINSQPTLDKYISALTTYSPAMYILVNNSTDNTAQTLALWVYNPDMKSLVWGGYCRRPALTGYDELSRYELVNPIEIRHNEVFNETYLIEPDYIYLLSNNNNYQFPYSHNYIPHGKSTLFTKYSTIVSAITAKNSTGTHYAFMLSAGDITIKYSSGTRASYPVGGGTKVESAYATDKSCYILIPGTGIKKFSFITTPALSIDPDNTDLSDVSITDFCLLYSYSTLDEIYFLTFDGRYVKIVSFDTLTNAWSALTTIYDTGKTLYTKINCQMTYPESNSIKKCFLMTLYNKSEFNIYKFTFDSSDGSISNFELSEIKNKYIIPFVDGDIQSICFHSRPMSMPVNHSTQIGIRPYYGVTNGLTDAPTPTAGTGTVTVSTSSTAVTGSGTAFTSQLGVGDTIIVTTAATTYETRIVESIASDTSLTVDRVFANGGSGKAFTFYENQDLYGVPILPSYDSPINLDAPTRFNPFVHQTVTTGVTRRWLWWNFYVFTPPVIEKAVTGLYLFKGWYDSTGVYQVKAFGNEATGDVSDEFISKVFPITYGVDSVVLHNVAGGSNTININSNYVGYGTSQSRTSTVNPNNAGAFNSWFGESGSMSIIDGSDVDGDKYVEITPGGATDKGLLLNQKFSLTYGKTYILKFYVYSASTTSSNYYIYPDDYGTKAGLNVDGTWSIGAGETGAWKEITKVFTPNYKAETTWVTVGGITNGVSTTRYLRLTNGDIWNLRLDADGAETIRYKNVSITTIDYFNVDTIWKSWNEDRIKHQDYKVGTTFNCLLDYENYAAYLTTGGVLFHDKGNALTFPSRPVACAFNDTGLWIATEKDIYLIQGSTADSVSQTKVMNDGLELDNEYGLTAYGNFAALYNDKSVYVMKGGVITDIGSEIEPYIKGLTGDRYIAIDMSTGEIWIPIKPDAVHDLTITDPTANPDIEPKVGYAIFKMTNAATASEETIQVHGSWRIYAYNADNDGHNFLKYSKTFNSMIGNVGDSVCILEVNDHYAKTTMAYENEAWDRMMIVLRMREASFGNIGYMKKLRWIDVSASSLRDSEDLAPFDYMKVEINQNYNPYGTNQITVESVENYNFDVTYPDALSYKMPLKANLYTGTTELTFARTRLNAITSTPENPKVILRDILYEIIDINRSHRGGY
jgi:hypothetical protein